MEDTIIMLTFIAIVGFLISNNLYLRVIIKKLDTLEKMKNDDEALKN